MGDLFSADLENPTLVRLFERLSGAEAAKIEAKSASNIAFFNAAVQRQEAEAQRQKATFEQQR